MTSPVFPPLIEVFLLVEQPRQRLSHWSRALAALDAPGAPPMASVDAYYDPTSNQALFGLRYDQAALGPERLSLLVEVTVLAEIGMIQPADLSEGDRRRFVVERLAKCTVHVSDQRKIVSALVELVRRVRAQKPTTNPITPITIEMPPRARPRIAVPTPPRGEASDREVMAPAPRSLGEPSPALAKGTRNGDPVEPPLARASRLYPVELDPIDDPDDPITTPARQLVGTRAGEAPKPSPNVVTRSGVHRANTVTMSTVETQRMLDAVKAPGGDTGAESQKPRAQEPRPAERARTAPPGQDPPGVERARAPSQGQDPGRSDRVRTALPTHDPPRVERRVGTQPEPPHGLVAGAVEDDVIYARYLRDGRWVPVRIGALSLRRATLMAGALPRVDDRVDVALSFVSHRAAVRGTVTKVSTRQEAATTGAAMFSVSFELDDNSRRQLTVLLTAARAANVTIKPPPPRSTRRYPVEWPISLGTVRGAVRAEALDVSTDGMFVKPLHALTIDANLTFSAVLDDGLAAISGRTRVVRNVTDSEAQAAGLLSGYGLCIMEMAGPDRARWSAFLARIEKRAAKRVLIGASPARLAELQGGLVAAGYAVTGGTDVGALAQLASAEARPVDAALVDAAWIADGQSASWVESLFSARNVPCVTIHGDARRARIAIDRLLSVV